MKYLFVVAHPDDETLGAGATINKLAKQGNTVDVCIMCYGAAARAFRPGDDELAADIDSAFAVLNVNNTYKGDFPNIKMNNTPHLDLVQFIENAITASEPDVIVTHHPSDTNNDHLHTSMACQAAARLFQRKAAIKPLNELWFMETLSSTDWSVNSSIRKFEPNMYIEVGEDGMGVKLNALAQYRDVMRPYPHPRSGEAVKGLAAYRGAQAGCKYAEAFECVFRRIV